MVAISGLTWWSEISALDMGDGWAGISAWSCVMITCSLTRSRGDAVL